jgi:hypothetical protein
MNRSDEMTAFFFLRSRPLLILQEQEHTGISPETRRINRSLDIINWDSFFSALGIKKMKTQSTTITRTNLSI